jgi:(1->4)-alpha-D-glucan 1-alpha-D-glucosylmutase
MLNSLSQLTVALMAPGVPDTYQGCEFWDFNMVDPDNRRPVDFALHQRLLTEVKEADRNTLLRDSLARWQDGKVKLALAATLIRCRRDHADLFRQGSYEPISIDGPLSHHLIAFRRVHGAESCVIVAGRLFAALLGDRTSYDGAAIWHGATLTLPEATPVLTNVLTGATVAGRTLELGEVLADAPVAVLLG